MTNLSSNQSAALWHPRFYKSLIPSIWGAASFSFVHTGHKTVWSGPVQGQPLPRLSSEAMVGEVASPSDGRGGGGEGNHREVDIDQNEQNMWKYMKHGETYIDNANFAKLSINQYVVVCCSLLLLLLWSWSAGRKNHCCNIMSQHLNHLGAKPLMEELSYQASLYHAHSS